MLDTSARKMFTIPQALHSSTIIVTGGSGFLGASLILRLVQSDLAIKTIYAIVRAGANEVASDRLVKELKPYLDERDDKGAWKSVGIVRAVAGDCSLLGLGLSKEDGKLLSKEADILIHCAANTAFGRPLSVLSINISMAHASATFSLLSAKIKTHIHISTVMTGAHLADKEVYEEKLQTETVVAKHENNYVLSKSVAEGIINSFGSIGSKTNFTIVRVSIVAPAYRFPVIGYGAELGSSPVAMAAIAKTSKESSGVHGKYPEGIAADFGIGNKLDCIPVDICSNQIIAITASTHVRSVFKLPFSVNDTVEVFHSAVGMDGLVCIEWDDATLKIKVPSIPVESIFKNYGHFFSRTLNISTDRARFIYGLKPKSGLKIDTANLMAIDCTGFEVEFDNFESFGLKKYLRLIRDRLDHAEGQA